VICVATHYEGDPCDNTKAFYRWFRNLLRDKKNPKPFEGMKFAIFGLGDTSYEQYNEMGKYFDKGFEQLGATRLCAMECGNAEHHTTEDDFENWRIKLWPALI
jgi:NADPH-ferrihemoprotein reductase